MRFQSESEPKPQQFMRNKIYNILVFIILIIFSTINTLTGQDCYPPEYSEANTITGTTATLYWEDYESHIGWNIVISSSALDNPSEAPITATINGTEEIMTYTVQGLSPETDYYYYIQTICSESSSSSDWYEGEFHTRCADKSVPYTDDFNSYGSSQSSFPTCWTKIQGTSYTTNVDATHVNILKIRGYTAVATPSFNQPINTLRINFETWAQNISVPLEIGIIEDLDNWETYTMLETIELSTASTYFQKEVHLDTYSGNGQYIVFYNPSSSDHYIDNLTISVIPNCLNPMNVTTSVVTPTSATLVWNEVGDATQWRVLLSSSAITDFTNQNPIVCNTTSYTANSLTENTPYYFYVQSVCSGENSSWSSATFTTQCEETTLPTLESFVANQTPSCWTQERISGNADVMFVAFSMLPYCHPAGGSAMVKWPSASNPSGWQSRLISLPISTTGISALDVNFKWHHDLETTSGAEDGVQIQYSTDGITWNNSTQGTILRYDGLQSGWCEYDVIIPEAGNLPRVYVGFLFNSGGIGANCYVDEITFKAASGCYTPVNLTASNITGNGATLSWDEVGNASNWDLLLSETPVSDFANVSPITLSTTSHTLTNLNPSTTYYAYVRSRCSSNSYSEWSTAILFSTSCGSIINLPHIESFDTYGTCSSAFPPCWVRHGQPDLGSFFSNGQYCSTPSATDLDAIDGDKSLMLCTPSGSFTYTITPPIQEDIRNVSVTFFLQKSSEQYSGTLEIGVMSNPNDFATFESIATITPSTVGEWEFFPISLASANQGGSGKRIAFRHGGFIDESYYLIDELTIMVTPDCWPATHLDISEITGNSATISWMDPNEPTAQWNVKVSDYPMNDMTQTANVFDQTLNTTSFTLDYLSGNTTYYYYLQSDCGNDSLGIWLNGTFTTLPCNCYVNIYMQDSWGNGWEGAKIQMKHGTTVFAEATIEGNESFDTARIYTCEAINIDYYFVSGSYDSDISFTITNSLGNTIYVSNGTPVAGCFTSGVPACGVSCNMPPGNLTVNSTADGNVLTWGASPNALSYTVYRDNTIIADYVTATSYTDTEPILTSCTYTVTARCIVGESGPSNEVQITGIEDNTAGHQINLFPNPAHDRFTITADFPFSHITVVNLLGQEVISLDNSGNQAEVSTAGLSNGIYLVKIHDGQKWIVRKIAIE